MNRLGHIIALAFVCFALGYFTSLVVRGNEVEAPTAVKVSYPEENVYRVWAHSFDKSWATGTAFKLKFKQRYVLITAQHVCEGLEENEDLFDIAIETPYGLANSTIIAMSTELDICVLTLPFVLSRESNALELADRSLLKDESLFTIGYPGQRAFRVIHTAVYIGEILINAPTYALHGQNIHAFDGVVIPGQSGSPVLNQYGKVIGILVVSKWSAKQGGYTDLLDLRKFLAKTLAPTSNQ